MEELGLRTIERQLERWEDLVHARPSDINCLSYREILLLESFAKSTRAYTFEKKTSDLEIATTRKLQSSGKLFVVFLSNGLAGNRQTFKLQRLNMNQRDWSWSTKLKLRVELGRMIARVEDKIRIWSTVTQHHIFTSPEQVVWRKRLGKILVLNELGTTSSHGSVSRIKWIFDLYELIKYASDPRVVCMYSTGKI